MAPSTLPGASPSSGGVFVFMFKCKVCAEKDKRVEDLQSRVAFLEKWLTEPRKEPAMEQLEADALFNASSHIIEIPENHETPPSEYPPSQQEIDDEARNLLMGTY